MANAVTHLATCLASLTQRDKLLSRMEAGTAERSTEIRELSARNELRLGGEEREDLKEVVTIATLEIKPGSPS